MPLNKRVRRRLVLLSVLLLVVVAALSALFLFSRWNRDREVERSANEGMAAYERGDYKSALGQLSYAVTHRKDNLELALALGDTRLRNIEPSGRHYPASAAYYQHALSLDPTNEEALRALVDIYMAIGDSSNVLAYSTKLSPDDLNMTRARIKVLGGTGRTEEALEEVANLRDLTPNAAEWVLIEIELRRRDEERIESLLAYLDEIEFLHPNNQAIPFVRIPLLRQIGQTEQATLIAREIANLSSIDPDIVMPLLRQLSALNMAEETQGVLKQAQKFAKNDSKIAYQLVQRLAIRSAYASALVLALEMADVFPDDLRFLRLAVLLASYDSDEIASEQLYERLLVASRNQDTARAEIDALLIEALRASAKTDIADLRAGITSIQSARALDPTNPSLRLIEANLLNRTEQTDAAINAYENVFESLQSQGSGVQLVNLLLRNRQNVDALNYANQLLRLYPSIETYALKVRAWIGLRRSGQDPSTYDNTFNDQLTITQQIIEAYNFLAESTPHRATLLLPLIASSASLEGDDDSFDFAVNEVLQSPHSTSVEIIQILDLERIRNGNRAGDLLRLAEERGASPFNVARMLAQQARDSGNEEAALAILNDARGQLKEGSKEDQRALRQILTFVASTPEPSDSNILMLDAIFQQLPRDPTAARLIASYPEIWTRSPELAQRAIDQIGNLLGDDSYTYVISNARRVMALNSEDSAARASALAALDQLVLNAPSSIEALLLMSDLLRSGPNPDLPGSANYLRKAVEARPDQSQLYPTLIQLLQQVGDRERALEYLNRYQEIASDTSAARNRVALLVRQGEYGRAIEELMIVADESRDPLDRIALAQFLAREGQMDAALAQYDLALELDPGNRFALDGKILLLAATDRISIALDIIRESEILDDRTRLTMAIESYLAASDFEGALVSSNALIQLQPESVDTWILAGRIRAQTNDLSGARSALRQALEIDPDNTVALGQLLPLLVANPASWAEARELLPRLEASSPTLSAVLELTMDASNPEDSSFSPSAEHLARSLQIVRTYPGAIGPRRLAWTLHSKANDHAAALEIAQESMSTMPANPAPGEWAFESSVRTRDWNRALEIAYEIRDRSATGTRLINNLRIAELSLNLGRVGDALLALEPYEPIIQNDEQIYLNIPVLSRGTQAENARIANNLRGLLMRSLLLNGRVDRAYSLFSPLFDVQPNLAVVWIATANAMDKSDARAALRRIEPAISSNPNMLLQLSQTWLQLAAQTEDPDDREAASKMIERTMQVNPILSREARLLKAQLEEIGGDLPASIAIHQEIIDEHSSEEIQLLGSYANLPQEQQRELARMRRIYATALNNLAYQTTKIDDGDLDRALSDINKAIEFAPPNLKSEFLDTKAVVLIGLGNPDDALATINEATTLAPNRVDFQIRAIRILITLGRPQEAKIRAREVLLGLDRNGLAQSPQADEINLLIEEIG